MSSNQVLSPPYKATLTRSTSPTKRKLSEALKNQPGSRDAPFQTHPSSHCLPPLPSITKQPPSPTWEEASPYPQATSTLFPAPTNVLTDWCLEMVGGWRPGQEAKQHQGNEVMEN